MLYMCLRAANSRSTPNYTLLKYIGVQIIDVHDLGTSTLYQAG